MWIYISSGGVGGVITKQAASLSVCMGTAQPAGDGGGQLCRGAVVRPPREGAQRRATKLVRGLENEVGSG